MKSQMNSEADFTHDNEHLSLGRIAKYDLDRHGKATQNHSMLPEVQPNSAHTVHSTANPSTHNSH